ncbi:MAG: hypothetical protein Ct9H300mP32_5850 [Verrucomicrobiota bacterium]|nr:MAG: hypothetical protein Ct9H300mP32_5850 [Verrucomicrobiota bacterium]
MGWVVNALSSVLIPLAIAGVIAYFSTRLLLVSEKTRGFNARIDYSGFCMLCCWGGEWWLRWCRR